MMSIQLAYCFAYCQPKLGVSLMDQLKVHSFSKYLNCLQFLQHTIPT